VLRRRSAPDPALAAAERARRSELAERLDRLSALRRDLAAAPPGRRPEARRRLDEALGGAIAVAAAGEQAHLPLADRLPVTRAASAALDATRFWGAHLADLMTEREALRFAAADDPVAPEPARMRTAEGSAAH
jgi:hypothetical protein